MGKTYTFVCEACGYRAEVCGGRSAGFLIEVQTITCADCAELYDVAIGERPLLPVPAAAAPEDDFAPPTFLAVDPGCPRGKGHVWQRWHHPGPCPRCGETMIRSEQTLFDWD